MVSGAVRPVLLPRLLLPRLLVHGQAAQALRIPTTTTTGPSPALAPQGSQTRYLHGSARALDKARPLGFSVPSFRRQAEAALNPRRPEPRNLATPASKTIIARWKSTAGRPQAQAQDQKPSSITPSEGSTAQNEASDVGDEAVRHREDSQEQAADAHHQHGFTKSERATRAAHVNLTARLSKEGKTQGKPALKEIWRLIKIARPELKYLGVAVGFLVVSSSVTLSLPWIVGRVLDLVTKAGDAEVMLFGLTLSQFFMCLGGLLTLGAAANFARIILLRIIGERVVARLRSQLYRRTYVQDAEFFDANRVGDLISRLGSDCVIVAKSITQNVSDGLRALFAGTAAFSAMVWLSPQLSAILLVVGPPVAFGGWIYGKAIRNVSRQIQKNIGTLSKIGEERLGNVKTSQAFVGELQEVKRYNQQVRKLFGLGRKESTIYATFFATTGWVGNMAILGMLVIGGKLVQSGALSVGNLTSFMMYTAFAGGSVSNLTGFFSELMKGLGAASRLFELQDRKPTIAQTVGLRVSSAQGPIKFNNVSFAYPTRPSVNIFNGINFEIPSGSNVCVVGPSGGGKSTVASLLLRFYNPTSGNITINGVDISKVNVKSLRRRIGVVSQEPVLFSGTIAENIAYAKPDATQAEIVLAAKKANCTFISDLPDGLETQVGARGSQLSGGQKQRIAIARALVKNPDILILDEATSALDAESETLVNEALVALLKGRNTTISIAHRLSTIKRSDKIIVLSSEGTVAEIGSYAELWANKRSAFSKLMEWQMSGGEIADPRSSESLAHATEAEEIEQDLEEAEEEADDEDGDANRRRESKESEERRQDERR